MTTMDIVFALSLFSSNIAMLSDWISFKIVGMNTLNWFIHLPLMKFSEYFKNKFLSENFCNKI